MSRWLLLGLAACASDTALEIALCDLLQNGPSTAVTAAASGGPQGFVDASRVDITLLDDGNGRFAGEVLFTADEVGSFVLGLSDAIPVVLHDATGAEVPLGEPVRSADCAELALRYTVDLELEPYTLVFGPTSTATFSLVAEESDDDR